MECTEVYHNTISGTLPISIGPSGLPWKVEDLYLQVWKPLSQPLARIAWKAIKYSVLGLWHFGVVLGVWVLGLGSISTLRLEQQDERHALAADEPDQPQAPAPGCGLFLPSVLLGLCFMLSFGSGVCPVLRVYKDLARTA